MINYWKRNQRQPVLLVGSELSVLLDRQPECDEADTHWIDHEYRREIFRWAAEQIRKEFRERTWQAFWQTCVDGRPIAIVAAKLDMSVGAAYVARSRVMARLKDIIQTHEGSQS
jgi:RNA polymerase sigma-70 factor (ECF subfamily)